MSKPALRASLVIASVALLAASSGDEKSVSDDRSPEEVMELAATTLDETSGVQLSLSSEGLPEATGRRDGSGTPGSQPIAACAGPVAQRLDPATRVSG